MLDNVAKNLKRWDEYHDWPADGDEWNRQAAACGVDYGTWKRSAVAHLIDPFVTAGTRVLEIAPGHGRWTEFLAPRAGHVIAVDLSQTCLDYCRQRFRDRPNIDYVLTDGVSLPMKAGGSIDFLWSFDSFVHMDRDVIAAYLREAARVLKPGGMAIIHHANVENVETHSQDDAVGWRSAMTADLFAALARDAGLTVDAQFVYWDEANKIGVPRLGDRITRVRKPAP